MNILLIEDNLADRLLTQEAFKKASVESVLQCVDDGELAINKLNELAQLSPSELPDIILSDMNLPRKGGHAVLSEVKSSAEFQHIPVIILSGSISQRDVDLSHELGACAHLAKPSSMEEFYSLAASIVKAWSPAGFLFKTTFDGCPAGIAGGEQ